MLRDSCIHAPFKRERVTARADVPVQRSHVVPFCVLRTSMCDGPDSSCMLSWLFFAHKNIAHFHGSGALRLNAAMSTEQTHQRLGAAFQNCSTSCNECRRDILAHESLQTVHQDMSLIRNQIDKRARIWLAEPKSLSCCGSPPPPTPAPVSGPRPSSL